MCGISGLIDLQKSIDINLLKNMTDIIKHRGPDDEGYYLWSPSQKCFAGGADTVGLKELGLRKIEDVYERFVLGFGHRRLSILDVSSRAHQPMSYKNKYHIVHNGEIYNYIELREVLEQEGYSFSSQSDTEVILAAYAQWGEDCVKQFNGEWAFALWDEEKQVLFCSRDRFGVKPLYYYRDRERFSFSSEIKQILEDESVPRVVEKETMYAYLSYNLIDYNEKTFFKDIFALKPAHNMHIEIDAYGKIIKKVVEYRYWDLGDAGDSNAAIDKSVCDVGKKLNDSVKLRMRSDVEVGSCLSGGLDSSSIVTLACQHLETEGKTPSSFETFTSSFESNPEVDEREYSKMVVQASGCRENLVFPDIDTLQTDFEKMIWHQDQPFSSLSIFASWSVMKAAHHQGIKVLLDGQGGDEVLLGYRRFYVQLINSYLSKGQFIKAIREYRQAVQNSNLTMRLLFAAYFYFTFPFMRKLNARLITGRFINKRYKNGIKTKIWTPYFKRKDMRGLYQNDFFHYSIPPLVRYEDRTSMAFSIEARVPFLDYKFVEESVAVPIDQKIRTGWTKNLLREYMRDKMPKEVVYRKNKMGFDVPQKQWVEKLSVELEAQIFSSEIRSRGLFDMQQIKSLFKRKKYHVMKWRFISVELWMRLFDLKSEE